MTRTGAAVGSAVFALLQPGVVAGLIPYLITAGWQGSDPPLSLQVVGALVLVAGLVVLAQTVIRFVVEGRGTPFPGAPTRDLVIGGLYRHVRNPMYLAVIATILGQAAILGSIPLVGYAAAVWVVVASFVHAYEEPTLARTYGEQYAAYCRAVRAWVPRPTPWTGPEVSHDHRMERSP